MELLHAKPDIALPAHPKTLKSPTRGAVSLRNVMLRYPSRPDYAALDGLSLDVNPAKRWRWWDHRALANPASFRSCCASIRYRAGR